MIAAKPEQSTSRRHRAVPGSNGLTSYVVSDGRAEVVRYGKVKRGRSDRYGKALFVRGKRTGNATTPREGARDLARTRGEDVGGAF